MLLISILGKRIRLDPSKMVAGVAGSAGIVAIVFKFIPDPTSRWIALGCIVGVVVLVFGVRWLLGQFTRAKLKSLLAALEQDQKSAVNAAAAADERARLTELRNRFQGAVGELKHARKTIYDLPWIMLIGEPQSGKSMTLRGSELHWPLPEGIPGFGGTRNCDWWFANEAIFLDTAGRFAFHERDSTDQREWESFLDLLSRKRRRCPINGVLVIVPADKLLNDPPDVRKQKAGNIHAKLNELQRKLGVQFPVFLLITKCDLVVGFSEFFQEFGDVEAAQMVGWTNDVAFEQAYNPERFGGDFETIRQRLHQRRLELIRRVPSMEERGLIYTFPDEFLTLKGPLQQYLNIIFAPDTYHDSAFFRGFYFTSGIQEGTPIVTVSKELLAGGRAPATSGAEKEFDVLGKLFPPRPFFCADAYKAKALKETGMVFRSSGDIRRSRRLKTWTYVGGGVSTVVLAGLLAFAWLDLRKSTLEPQQHAAKAYGTVTKNVPEAASFTGQSAEDFKKSLAEERLTEEKEEEPRYDLARKLDTDAAKLKNPPWLRRVALFFRDQEAPANHLRAIQDHLYVRGILAGRIREIEDRLSNSENWKSDFNQHRESTRAYFQLLSGTCFALKNAEARSYLEILFGPLKLNPETLKQLWEGFSKLSNVNIAASGIGSADVAVRKVLCDPPPAGGVETVMAGAREAFAAEFARRTASTHKPWFDLEETCSQVRSRWEELARLHTEFGDSKSTDVYSGAVKKWQIAYQGDEKELGFFPALNKTQALVQQLPGQALVPPKLEDLRKHWSEFFGSSEMSPQPPQSLLGIVDAAPTLLPDAQSRIRNRLNESVAGLNAEATKTVEAIEAAKKAQIDKVWVGEKLIAEFEECARCLATLDAYVTKSRGLRVGDKLDGWVDELKLPVKSQSSKAALPLEKLTCDEKDKELGDLIVGVKKAAMRDQWFVDLERVHDRLCELPPDRLTDGADTKLLQSEFGYSDLEKRYTGGFAEQTIKLVVSLQKHLRETNDPNRPLEGPLRLCPNSKVGGPPQESATDLVAKALDSGLKEYFAAYRGRWKELAKQKLDGFEALMVTANWAEFREEFVKVNKNGALTRQVERRLKTACSSLSGFEAGENDVSVRLSWLRDALSEYSPFQSLLDELLAESWKSKDSKLTADSFAYQIAKRYADSITKMPELLDVPQSILEMKILDPLDDLEEADEREFAKIRNDTTLQQMHDIIAQGRKHLNRRINLALKAIEPRAVFPLTDPGQNPPMAREDFESFLANVARFEKLCGKISEPWWLTPNELVVGRKSHLERCSAWVRFLFKEPPRTEIPKNPPAALESALPWLLGRNPPEPDIVFFDVCHREPRQGGVNRVGANLYANGGLVLGCTEDALRQAACQHQEPMEFSLLKDCCPQTGISKAPHRDQCPFARVWTVKEKSSVSLRSSAPAQGGPANLPNQFNVETVKIDSEWALPMLIYRFNPQLFAIIQPGQAGKTAERKEWVIPIEVQVLQQKASVYFQITLKDKELPELIRTFAPEVGKPSRWFNPDQAPPPPPEKPTGDPEVQNSNGRKP